jgi:5-methyltetrahydrofolate--homocysteine methyltransferase
MSRLSDALRTGRVLLMDGAMGTELARAGFGAGECGELWNLTRPEQVRAIHQAYVDAGAECLLTNTFQANPVALSRHGLRDRMLEIIRAGVDLARSVAGTDRFVLGDLGPFGAPGSAESDGGSEEELHGLLGAFASCDGLLLETYSDAGALPAISAALSALQTPALPLLFSFTYRRDAKGRLGTFRGDSPEECAKAIRDYPVVALGVNCGRDIGMEEIIEVVRRYRDHTPVPLFARPNAGTPTEAGGPRLYPHTPQAMADRLPELLEVGVVMVGGCCGTTPAHVAAYQRVVAAWNARGRR